MTKRREKETNRSHIFFLFMYIIETRAHELYIPIQINIYTLLYTIRALQKIYIYPNVDLSRQASKNNSF